MTSVQRTPMTSVGAVVWWSVLPICVVYGLFGLVSGAGELVFVLGLGPEPKHRAAPLVFVLHALAGGMALLLGAWQFHPRVRAHARVHRAIGKAYVVGVWLASTAAVLDAATFRVGVTAKLVFAASSTAWFAATTIALLRARARRFAEHREWMLRSFALTGFAVTFSIWVPLLLETKLPAAVGYPIALLLSAGLNLAAAEVWIRRTRAGTEAHG